MKTFILLLGEPTLPLPKIESIAKEFSCTVQQVSDRNSALSTLTKTKPAALILGSSWSLPAQSEFRDLISLLRADWRLHDVPLLASVKPEDNNTIKEAFHLGCDDILLPYEKEYRDKLKTLQENPALLPTPRHKSILHIEGSRLHRVIYSRLLSGAGYQTDAVETELEGRTLLQEKTPDLILLDLSLLTGDPFLLAEEIFKQKIRLIALHQYPLSDERRERAQAHKIQSFFQKNQPPEDLLFWINDLLLGTQETKRQSERRLWSEVVHFGEKQIGYSYNLSEGGLFIRTLAPPALGEQISIQTTILEKTYQATGKVVWVKPYTHRSSRSYPSGFGIAFDALSSEQNAIWHQLYQSLF